ncbi:putative serine/threonine-protein phosphatase with EF-hands [Plasmopara halstedii]
MPRCVNYIIYTDIFATFVGNAWQILVTFVYQLLCFILSQMEGEEDKVYIQVGARVLVHGKYAGIVRYIPESTALVGVELTRPRGESDGTTKDGTRVFTCKPLHGLFVREEQLRPFSEHDKAACVLQSVWRRYGASQKFRHLVFSHAWNLLDNTQEQLNLRRSEQLKSAEHTLAQLTKKQSLNRTVSEVAVAEIIVEPEYEGPHLIWPLELSNVLKILSSFKTTTIFHHKYVLQVLKEGVKSLAPLPTLQEITLVEGEKLTVVGDLHGQLQDLFSIFSINGLPTRTNKYLFNGDFVDRGMYGVEVVMTILLFRLLYPTSVFLNRGNHESRNQNSWMGFEDEVWDKYSAGTTDDLDRPACVFECFQTFFESIPLCAVLQQKVFVVHGGLFSRDNVTLAHLRKISRKREPPLHESSFEDKIFEDMLWSDPRMIQSRQPSERGAGVEFGVSVTNNFCLVNKIALIIRSHECVIEGFEILHGGRLITLFSASRYCGTQMNKGAFLTLGPDLHPEIQQFYAHSINETTFKAPEPAQLQGLLEEDTLRMIAERICDHKASLYWYFTQHDDEQNGSVSRLIWAEALRSVLQLDLPFLTYQPKLADETLGRINYSRFLSRYRIENDAMDNSGWQESIIALICKKLYRAMGAGDMQQAFKVFDTDSSGFIEYEEFLNTLKQMDTGLSDQQVFALMRTADTNDDGRIDFNEFAHRFEVIFTDLGSSQESSPRADPGQTPMEISTDEEAAAEIEPIFTRRVSPGEDQSTFTPQPASNLDVETMGALLQIGKALFARPGSLQYHFYHFDKNQDGVLSHREFELALKQLGFDFEPSLLYRVMAAVDRDGGRSIDYKEFVTAFSIQDLKEQETLHSGDLTWQNSVLQQVSNVLYQHRIHIRNAFRMFDAKNSGFISRTDFRTAIRTFNVVLNSPLSDDQIEELLNYLDSDQDGVISYKEFFDGFRVVDVRVNDDKENEAEAGTV